MNENEIRLVIKQGLEILENTATVKWFDSNSRAKVTKISLIDGIYLALTTDILMYKAVGYTDKASFSRCMSKIFTDIPNKPGAIHWKHYLIFLAGYKLCPKCEEIKKLEDFSGGKGYCNECMKGVEKEYRENNKEKIALNVKENRDDTRQHICNILKEQNIKIECVLCGYDKNWAALDFHHKNSGLPRNDYTYDYKGNKKSPSSYIFSVSKELAEERYFEEADNFEILCKNCHTEVHNERDFMT